MNKEAHCGADMITESNQSAMRLRLINLKKLLKEAIAANEACDLATLLNRLLDIGGSAFTGEKIVDDVYFKRNGFPISKYAAPQRWKKQLPKTDGGEEDGV